MIIFGSNSSHLKSEHLTEAPCPHCNTTDSIDISIFGKYAHVFWIPTFPLGKTGVSQCSHCQQTLKEKEMPPTFKDAFKTFKKTLKTPIWHFSGLLLIAIFLGWAFMAGSQNDKNNLMYIQSPQAGDIYELKSEGGYFTLAKVAAVDADSVYVIFNKYEIARSSKLKTLNKAENFQGDEYAISHEGLQGLFSSKEIIDVER